MEAKKNKTIRWIVDTLLARPTATDKLSITVQILLMPLVWSFTLYFSYAIGRAGAGYLGYAPRYTIQFAGNWTEFGFNLHPTWFEVMLPFILCGLGPCLVSGVAWLPFRIVARRERDPSPLFIRACWRTCYIGLFVIPAGALAAECLNSLQWINEGVWILWVLLAYWLLAPALFARDELRRRTVRLARWRPACPECGYNLRKLAENRCPECGEPFLTTQRAYRRWARPRLLWDRRLRGSGWSAYLKSVLLLIFRPGLAADGLILPDRNGRATRWCLAHVLLLSIAAVVTRSQYSLRELLGLLFEPADGIMAVQGVSAARYWIWLTQSLCAWLIALSLLPALGAGLAYALPGQPRIARRGFVKWSLYAVAPAALLAAGGFIVHLSFFVGPFNFSNPLLLRLVERPPTFFVIVLLYAFWWARGVTANPYSQRTGFEWWILHFVIYIAAWLALYHLVFPPDALEALL